MIAQNVCLDKFDHIIKKMHFRLKTGVPHMRALITLHLTHKFHMHTDRPILSRNAILILCGLVSHQNKGNK